MYQLPFTTNDKVIELGGGAAPVFRPNVDARPCFDHNGQQAVDFTADFEQPLPIMSNEWDGVFAKYVIEHVSWRKINGFVSEVYRILRTGGIAVVVTANAEAQMRWALRQDWDERVSQCLGGDQDYPDNTHKVFFNPAWIARIFRAAGFPRVVVVPFGELGTDMIVEARK
jgi:predicted SAM-dependent methyltransferase